LPWGVDVTNAPESHDVRRRRLTPKNLWLPNFPPSCSIRNRTVGLAVPSWPERERVDEHRLLPGSEWIDEADAPAVHAGAVGADAEAHEVLEAGMVERGEGLCVLVAETGEQREVRAEQVDAEIDRAISSLKGLTLGRLTVWNHRLLFQT
jgi:hypothetical protein